MINALTAITRNGLTTFTPTNIEKLCRVVNDMSGEISLKVRIVSKLFQKV